MSEHPKNKRLFGRSQGKALSARQQRVVDTLLPQLSWSDEAEVDPKALLPDAQRHVLEIGFGGAEHLIGQGGPSAEDRISGY
jgi:tRNA (guanine-N7-)-methyltransferase